ncbi:MAG TPA: hypothetical protein VES19_05795 [Candidatus Limnocylindrales bacterium]|nr:hypothetical protein [Candidatus Limnocylindrales bacterium]
MTDQTRPQLTDTLIEKMLAQRAGPGAPADLIPSIVAAIDSTGQRAPGLLGAGRSPRRLTTTRLSPRLAAAARVGVSLGAVAVLVVAAGLLLRRPGLTQPVGGPAGSGSPAASHTSGSATPSAATPTVAQVTVSLGIYSGRPDPSWDLTAAEAAAVVGIIDRLPTATGTPPQGGLGYHGFTLVIRRAGQPDTTLVAYRGAVAPPGVGPRPHLADPGRTLERSLLDAGRSTLAPVEVAAVEADLKAIR